MEEKDFKNLDTYFNSKTANSEFVEDLFENESNEPQLRGSLHDKWEDINRNSSEKLNLKHILYKIHFNINSKEHSARKSISFYSWFSRIAVVLVLPLLALSIYFLVENFNPSIQYTEIVAPKGEKAQFVLPDGSSGYLNSGSTLSYAYPFNKNRIVKLNGEGYFDVIHSSHKFVIQAEGVSIQVHGTRFNVCAYEDELEIKTTLVEGSVSMERDIDGKGLTLEPGQQATFKKSNQEMFYRSVDVDLYVSWKDNMLRFHNTPFADVVKKMERWYDVKIILEDNLKYTQRYTMTIKTESLREMLDLMVVSTPMSYQIKEDTVYINRLKNEVPMN